MNKNPIGKSWDFIESTNFEWDQANNEQRAYFRDVCASFLRTVFTPPPGYAIESIEAEWMGKFPVVALGCDFDIEPIPKAAYEVLIETMRAALDRFIDSVDWDVISHIKFGSTTPEAGDREFGSAAVTWLEGFRPGRAI
ncbi:hypothetical protein [Capsulimonas corticalis]|nr:hypothetical protein [Capsulimonas corticalis]